MCVRHLGTQTAQYNTQIVFEILVLILLYATLHCYSIVVSVQLAASHYITFGSLRKLNNEQVKQ